MWEQLHTAHPQRCVKCCFLSSLDGGTVGRVWRSSLSWFLKPLKKCLFCNDHNKMLFFLLFYAHFKAHPLPWSFFGAGSLFLALFAVSFNVFPKFPWSSRWKNPTTSLTFRNAFLSYQHNSMCKMEKGVEEDTSVLFVKVGSGGWKKEIIWIEKCEFISFMLFLVCIPRILACTGASRSTPYMVPLALEGSLKTLITLMISTWATREFCNWGIFVYLNWHFFKNHP